VGLKLPSETLFYSIRCGSRQIRAVHRCFLTRQLPSLTKTERSGLMERSDGGHRGRKTNLLVDFLAGRVTTVQRDFVRSAEK
jgi:hypothetical protein